MQICRLEMNEKATGFNQIFTLIKACSYLKLLLSILYLLLSLAREVCTVLLPSIYNFHLPEVPLPRMQPAVSNSRCFLLNYSFYFAFAVS